MRIPNHFLEVAELHARVALRRRERLVPEERLYLPDVGAASQQVCGDAVPEGVARDPLLDAGLLRPAMDDGTRERLVQVAAAIGDEEIRRALRAQNLRPAVA